MSLSNRITLLIVALLAISSLVAGVAFHRVFRQSLEAQLQGKLDARLAWLAAAIDVDTDDGEVQLEPGAEPADAAESWTVATTDGKTLWSSPTLLQDDVLHLTRPTSHGEPHWPLADSSELTIDRGPRAASADNKPWQQIPLADVPPAALQSARKAVPAFDPESAERRVRLKKGEEEGDRQFNIHGAAADREYEVRVTAAGDVLRIDDRTADAFAEYEIPEQHRIDLVVTAATSLAAVEAQLQRLSRVLWTVGPLVVLATAALLILLLRWQLRPLTRIAHEAAAIGPAQPEKRITDAGSSAAELVQLRASINAMLARLADALDRERRFASTAAHELRTPLAQMRTALEVALRKPREADEYRQTLADVSTDVDRLQKLVVGLLHLTRTADDAARIARPIPLLPLVHKAAQTCGPAPIAASAQDNLWTKADPDLLLAALCNVLENARRYAPAEPPSITIVPNNRTVEITIADRGPGIPEHERERIFQPLTRLDAARSVRDDTDGFGLGLATARSTLRAFGGDLAARPRHDGLTGSEFLFTLPLTPPPAND